MNRFCAIPLFALGLLLVAGTVHAQPAPAFVAESSCG